MGTTVWLDDVWASVGGLTRWDITMRMIRGFYMYTRHIVVKVIFAAF